MTRRVASTCSRRRKEALTEERSAGILPAGSGSILAPRLSDWNQDGSRTRTLEACATSEAEVHWPHLLRRDNPAFQRISPDRFTEVCGRFQRCLAVGR